MVVSFSSARAELPDPIDIHVGGRLRLRRNLVGMSQGQLGEACGLTFQQIQKYESGSNRVSASRLYRIARILGVNVAYFFEDVPVENSGADNEGFSDTVQTPLEGEPSSDKELLYRRETLELIRAYYRITDAKQRRKIYELVKTMAEQPS